jgi:hypothetical protein
MTGLSGLVASAENQPCYPRHNRTTRHDLGRLRGEVTDGNNPFGKATSDVGQPSVMR